MNAAQVDRLLALLRAQRLESIVRDRLARGTAGWRDSTARLDGINDQIMRVDETGSRDPGSGPELDLRRGHGRTTRRRLP